MNPKVIFATIEREMSVIPGIETGTMMSSPGLQFKGKNFMFMWEHRMVFRLGRDFDPASEGIHHYELLNPFKTKPPLKDWFVLTEQHEKWPLLAEIAYQKMKSKLA